MMQSIKSVRFVARQSQQVACRYFSLSAGPLLRDDEFGRYGNNDRRGGYNNNRNRNGGGSNRGNRGRPAPYKDNNSRNGKYGSRGSVNRFQRYNNSPSDFEFVERSFPPPRELTEDEKILKNSKVEDSKLDPDVKRAFIKNVGPEFTSCQEKSINAFVNNPRGIIVRAQTGTGKTFAFGLPIMESLKEKSRKRLQLTSVDSIIFAPTRDLAVQSKNSLYKVWKDCKANFRNNQITLVTGKIPMRLQLRDFSGANKPPIVVATPGRFIDLIQNEPSFQEAMKNVSNVVIDEADELLSQNFKTDLETIFSILKDISTKEDEIKFKTFLFSATMSNNVYELADQVIGEGYEFIDANEGLDTEVNKNIKQSLVVTKSIFESYASALQFIRSQIHDVKFKPMIFLPNTVSVDFFHQLLSNYIRKQDHIPRSQLPNVLKIHGKLTQGERNYSQREFRGPPAHYKGRVSRSSILVCSNVVSRGMDFPGVSHVIQIGVNSDLSNYTHRVGRTGRAGTEGHSLLISTGYEMPFVKKLIEHGNSFEEELEYEPNAEEELAIRDCARGMDYSKIATSNLGIYNSLPAKYGPILKQDYIKGCGLLYRDLHEDPESAEKPTMLLRTAQMMGLDTRMVSKYFDLDGNRGRRDDSYGGNSYGGNSYGDRGNSYGSSYGNRRGGRY